jgi:hypothetical protein
LLFSIDHAAERVGQASAPAGRGQNVISMCVGAPPAMDGLTLFLTII